MKNNSLKRPRGRPPLAAKPMRQVKVRLSEDDERIATVLGDGNLSAGVRAALRAYPARR